MSKNTGSLSERAMLVDLSIGMWEGRRKDKTTTEEVVDKAGAESDAGAWMTRTIPPKALKDIGAAVTKGRTLHFKFTLPWSDSGPRVLPAEMFLTYSQELRTVQQQFDAAVDAFIKEYPGLVSRAAGRLGKLSQTVVFPTVGELKRKFKWAVKISPLPDERDFRVKLGDDATKDIIAGIKQESADAMERAMGSLWDRLYQSVNKMSECLADDEKVFRDSLMTNMSDLCDLLPKLNVTGDANLAKLTNEVRTKLAKQVPDILRENKSARAETVKAAKEILGKMKTHMGV